MSGIDGIIGAMLPGTLGRIGPEPRTSGAGGVFKTVLNTVGAVADKAASFAGIGEPYSSILDTQIRLQQEMMLVSMYSNIEKTKHETSMAAVRNLRVG